MKTNIKILLVILVSIIISNNSTAQLNVRTNGSVKIGSGNGWPDGGDLQIVQNGRTTEARVFATSPNIARFGALNSLFAYVFGIDACGIGFISGGSDGSVNIMKFNTTGSVGINYSPGTTYKLYVGGSAYCTGVWQPSDINLKKDIKPIENATESLFKLNGKTYFYKNEKIKKNNDSTERKHYGFLAQDVQKVFPDLVMEGDDSCKTLALNYDGFIPLLVEALKKQQINIQKLADEIELLKTTNKPSVNNDNNSSSVNKLFQNSPNPFKFDTQIEYEIDNTAADAFINVYNLQGSQIKTYKISEKGNSIIIIKGSELNPGIFLYSLIVNGKIVDTKQMVLTN